MKTEVLPYDNFDSTVLGLTDTVLGRDYGLTLTIILNADVTIVNATFDQHDDCTPFVLFKSTALEHMAHVIFKRTPLRHTRASATGDHVTPWWGYWWLRASGYGWKMI